jgi:hypothetical protein
MKLFRGLLALSAIAFGMTAAGAQTFSLAGNWNSSSDSTANPWAYGTFSSGRTFAIPSTITNSGSTENFWTFPPIGDSDQSDPNIEKNLTSSAIMTSDIDFLPGTVSFGPYQGPAVAQFIVPASGLYNITAKFETDQTRGVTSDGTTAYVDIAGAQVYSQALLDPGEAQFGTAETFSVTSMALVAGEKIDFVVGGGAFTTEVDATLTELPEPATWALFVAGCAAVGFAARRQLGFAR